MAPFQRLISWAVLFREETARSHFLVYKTTKVNEWVFMQFISGHTISDLSFSYEKWPKEN